MAEKQWIPLESNPDVLTRFGHALGLSPLLSFADVWSLDLLDMVPSPRYAVLLLFPLTEKLLSAPGSLPTSAADNGSLQPYFARQTIGNACGTIALLHAALNTCAPAAPMVADSFLSSFAARTAEMTPAGRAAALVEDDGLDAVHGKFAGQGQTAAPAAQEKVDLHFVAFVEKGGKLWLLDGRKEMPTECGECKEGHVLEEAAKVIRERFMSKDPTEQRFTVMALTMAAE